MPELIVMLIFALMCFTVVVIVIHSIVEAIQKTMADIREILRILRANAPKSIEDPKPEPTLDELCRNFRIELELAQAQRRR